MSSFRFVFMCLILVLSGFGEVYVRHILGKKANSFSGSGAPEIHLRQKVIAQVVLVGGCFCSHSNRRSSSTPGNNLEALIIVFMTFIHLLVVGTV